jgi:hypothetical protein
MLELGNRRQAQQPPPRDDAAHRAKVARANDVLCKAQDMGKKIYSLEKFDKMLVTLLEGAQSLITPANAAASGVQVGGGDIRNMLRREQAAGGHSSRSGAADSREIVPWRGPYIYVYDLEEKARPLMIREYPKVANCTDGDWPQFRSVTNGRCPFVEEGPEAAARAKDSEKRAAARATQKERTMAAAAATTAAVSRVKETATLNPATTAAATTTATTTAKTTKARTTASTTASTTAATAIVSTNTVASADHLAATKAKTASTTATATGTAAATATTTTTTTTATASTKMAAPAVSAVKAARLTTPIRDPEEAAAAIDEADALAAHQPDVLRSHLLKASKQSVERKIDFARPSLSRSGSSRQFGGEPAASGMQISGITSAIQSQMISSTSGLGGAKAGTSKEVHDLRSKVLQRAGGSSAARCHYRTASGASASTASAAAMDDSRPAPLERSRSAGTSSLVGLKEAKAAIARSQSVPHLRKRELKPGYCENCADKYRDFDEVSRVDDDDDASAALGAVFHVCILCLYLSSQKLLANAPRHSISCRASTAASPRTTPNSPSSITSWWTSNGR